MFNILSRKGNTNPNNTNFPSHPSQIGDHQENKQQQMLVRTQGKVTLRHCYLEYKVLQPLWKPYGNHYGGSSKTKNRPSL
jgi:hypothetical protein